MPCLLLRKGQVCVPGPDGPVPALSPEGAPFDPFDVVDRLTQEYSMLYVVDLDGLEHGDPQLDYLQEISRDVTLWVDGGVRTAEQAIDILISGARRAVLSSAVLHGPRQLKRAWRLSTELGVRDGVRTLRPSCARRSVLGNGGSSAGGSHRPRGGPRPPDRVPQGD